MSKHVFESSYPALACLAALILSIASTGVNANSGKAISSPSHTLRLSVEGERLTEREKKVVQDFAAHMLRTMQSPSHMLITAYAGSDSEQTNADEPAMRRAIQVRGELAAALSFPRGSFVIQIEATQRLGSLVVVSQMHDPFQKQREVPRLQLQYDSEMQRFFIACPSGAMPLGVSQRGPDDLAILDACPENAQVPRAPIPSRASVDWDPENGRWVLRCPDGSPLRRGPRDPDDLFALKRCGS